jgi:hypothetical protein
VPAADFHGPDAFVFQADDGNGGTAQNTVTINVLSVRDAPIAYPQSLSTLEDTPLGITLTGSDADGDPITFEVATGATHGIISGTAPNLTYKPLNNYFGPDSFTYNVRDPSGLKGTAKISITVVSAPLIPTTLDAVPVIVQGVPRLSARLTRNDTGKPMPSRIIKFFVSNQQVCKAVTNGNGVATCGGATPSAAAAGGYKAVFDGDPDFAGSSDTGTLT